MSNIIYQVIFIILLLKKVQRTQGGIFRCQESKEKNCIFRKIKLLEPDNVFYSFGDAESIQSIIFVDSELNIFPHQIFESFTNLEELHAINVSLHAIHNGVFSIASELKVINVSYNEIQTLTKNTFEDGAIQLEVINVTHNKIQTIGKKTFDHLVKLKLIDFSYNFIETLPKKVFDKNRNLVEVDFSHNRLMNLETTIFYHNSELNYLYLDGNRLKDLKLHLKVNSLVHVETESNEMIQLTMQVDKLKFSEKMLSLYAFNNNLTSVNIHNFYVRALSLFNNSLQNMDFLCNEAFHTMEWINLEANKIQTINYNCLNHMLNLNELNLSENELNSFEAQLLTSLKHLKILYTFGNKIEALEAKEIIDAFPALKVMDISTEVGNTKTIVTKTFLHGDANVEVGTISKAYKITDKHFNVLIFAFITLVYHRHH